MKSAWGSGYADQADISFLRDIEGGFRTQLMSAMGGGFNPSTQQPHEIVVLAIRSPASSAVVR